MPVADDADPTTTAEGVAAAATDQAHALIVVRWVYPATSAVTILTSTPAVLGRDQTATTRLNGLQVSRRHAEVRLDGGRASVTDLGSKNGVFVNGRRVAEADITPGSVLRLGDCVGVVERLMPAGLPGFADLGHGIFGGSLMRSVVQKAKMAAGGVMPILLQGETGTGKERFARAIHAWSNRSGAFLPVNCAGYTASTAAAELFGYRKGAFTGAERSSVGHIRGADKGTLFLDEVVDLPLEVQAKLLRVFEMNEVLALGETRPTTVDVRFIAASQLPLAQLVAAAQFRADLRARLEGLTLELPPLRERRSDVCPLFLEFMTRAGVPARCQLDARVIEQLCLHDWPMNVRELEAVANRLMTLHGGATELGLQHLRDVAQFPPAQAELPSARNPGRRRVSAYDGAELEALLQAVERHRGNLTKASQELGISRPRAYRMLRAKNRIGDP